MIMELLLELASTVALTLLLCHFIFKLASSSPPPSFNSQLGDSTISLVRGCDFLVQSRISDSGFDNGVAILGDGVEDEASLACQDLEDDESGCTDERIVECGEFCEEVLEFSEKVLGVSEDLRRHGEKLVEQEIPGGNVVGEGETAVSPVLEEDDENRRTDEKIIERVEFAEEVPDFVDGSIGVSENLGCLGEKLVEQEISCESVEEEESAVSEALEEDESRCTEEKIIERAESGEEVREIVNESTEFSEDLGSLGENVAEQEISSENGSSLQRERNFVEERSETDNAGKIKESLGEEDDDDWVGIERTELEKLFGSAMAFVESSSNQARVSILDNDVKTKLYGLRKIATQGPCLEPQPMALKLSARAKWNAWQQLGEMTQETAMEQYVSLLSDGVPGWKHDELNKY